MWEILKDINCASSICERTCRLSLETCKNVVHYVSEGFCIYTATRGTVFKVQNTCRNMQSGGHSFSMKSGLNKLVNILFSRREQKAKWIYLIGSIPLAIFALIGLDYGAFFLYAIPAIILIFQFLYPTLVGWLFFLLIFTAGAITYTVLLISDIIKLAQGIRPSALVDIDDSIVFIFLIILLWGLTYGAFKMKPKTIVNVPNVESDIL